MQGKPKKEEFLIRHADYKILREALAYCTNNGPVAMRQRGLAAMARCAESIRLYCKHVDVSTHNDGTCIDCGTIVGLNGR